PAQPGWFVALGVRVTGPAGAIVDLSHTPIIAWLIRYRLQPDKDDLAVIYSEPVTVEGSIDIDKYPILTPQGEYVFFEDRTLDSKEEAIAYMNEKRRRSTCKQSSGF